MSFLNKFKNPDEKPKILFLSGLILFVIISAVVVLLISQYKMNQSSLTDDTSVEPEFADDDDYYLGTYTYNDFSILYNTIGKTDYSYFMSIFEDFVKKMNIQKGGTIELDPDSIYKTADYTTTFDIMINGSLYHIKRSRVSLSGGTETIFEFMDNDGTLVYLTN